MRTLHNTRSAIGRIHLGSRRPRTAPTRELEIGETEIFGPPDRLTSALAAASLAPPAGTVAP